MKSLSKRLTKSLVRSLMTFALLGGGPALAQEEPPADPEAGQPAPLAPLNLATFGRDLEDLELDYFTSPQGELRSVVGVIDAGVDRRQLEADPGPALAAGLRRYFDANRGRYGFAAGLMNLLVVDTPELVRQGELYSVKAHLASSGMRITRSAFSCLFARSGELMACSGNLPSASVDPARLPRSSVASPELAVQAAFAEAGLEYPADLGPYNGLAFPGRLSWVAQSGEGHIEVEEFVDAATYALLWKIETGEEWLVYDLARAQIVRRGLQEDDIHDSLPVQHRAPTAASFGASVGNSTLAQTERIGTAGPYKFNVLQYGQLSGYDWALSRVDDNNSPEVSSISGPNLPGGFPSNSGSALRQQTVFHWAWRARAHFRWDAWGTHAPKKTNTLDLLVDEPNKCSTPACFKDWGIINDPGLYFDFGEGAALEPHTIVHEFGHYIVWTYGDVDNGCDPGKDESDSIDESVADFVTQLVFHRLLRSSGIQNPYLRNNAWNPANSSYPRTFATSNCGQAAWIYGAPFVEAMWESLHGVDCRTRGAAACNGLSNSGAATPFGDFGWTNRNDANQSLTRALAFALQVTGDEPAFSDLKLWMMFDLLLNGQSNPAIALLRVASFHGF